MSNFNTKNKRNRRWIIIVSISHVFLGNEVHNKAVLECSPLKMKMYVIAWFLQISMEVLCFLQIDVLDWSVSTNINGIKKNNTHDVLKKNRYFHSRRN